MQPNFLLMIDVSQNQYHIKRTDADIVKRSSAFYNGRSWIFIVAPHSFVSAWISSYINQNRLSPKEIVSLWDPMIFNAVRAWNNL